MILVWKIDMPMWGDAARAGQDKPQRADRSDPLVVPLEEGERIINVETIKVHGYDIWRVWIASEG